MINNASTSLTGELTLISTPIGNLRDFNLRAIDVLKEADLLLCEDTRVTSKLLQAYHLTIKTESLHEHNENQRIKSILSYLNQGKKIALVSDAGTPLLSDPGYRLTREVIKANYKITAIPGPNAALMALTLSGLPPYPYMFLGFTAPKSAARLHQFSLLKGIEHLGVHSTLIWHESPHRLTHMLNDLIKVFGEYREAAVARELTKKFEEIKRGTLGALYDYFSSTLAKGEITVIVGPESPNQTTSDKETINQQLLESLKTMSLKDAATMVAKANQLPKKMIYQQALSLIQKP